MLPSIGETQMSTQVAEVKTETAKVVELSDKAKAANAKGAKFEIKDGKIVGGFETFEQAAEYFGKRETALKYLSGVARGQENHETPSSHPYSALAKKMLSTEIMPGKNLYQLQGGEAMFGEAKYTPQVGTPQKGKKGEADFEAASEDFQPAKYKGLKNVIKFIEHLQKNASTPSA